MGFVYKKHPKRPEALSMSTGSADGLHFRGVDGSSSCGYGATSNKRLKRKMRRLTGEKEKDQEKAGGYFVSGFRFEPQMK